ncbi:MAG: CheR family methyltransferase [Methanosarcinales archaeon]
MLKHCNEEYEKLLKSLTINVTEFFRNPEVFKAFEKKVIPELASRKGYIRIWSVGCATGEEPYSIAMLFQKNKIKNFKIYATDIDKNSLEEAMKGEYTKLPNNDMKQFFTCMNGSYKVKDEIKYRVKFARHDVLSDKPYKNMDVIFCRNMVIYLKTEAKKKLYMDFYDLLNKSGYLVLGKTELLLGEARDRFQVVDNVERIYQKYN